MKTLRIGTDIVKISRIETIMQKHPDFPQRILSKKEMSKQGHGYIARRWAAKEAIAKAIGLGFHDDCNFRDISILNDELGRPYVDLAGKTKDYMNRTFPGHVFEITVSDDEYAIAYCILYAPCCGQQSKL